MIRRCTENDFETIYSIVNDAATAYKGVIPEDRWREPYMPQEELRHEIDAGVVFWGYEESGKLIGIMGIQDVQDVTLFRHSYVRTAMRNHGVGGKLLSLLCEQTDAGQHEPALRRRAQRLYARQLHEGLKFVLPPVSARLGTLLGGALRHPLRGRDQGPASHSHPNRSVDLLQYGLINGTRRWTTTN